MAMAPLAVMSDGAAGIDRFIDSRSPQGCRQKIPLSKRATRPTIITIIQPPTVHERQPVDIG